MKDLKVLMMELIRQKQQQQEQQILEILFRQEQQRKIIELCMTSKSNENMSFFSSQDSIVNAIGEFKYNTDEEVTYIAYDRCSLWENL